MEINILFLYFIKFIKTLFTYIINLLICLFISIFGRKVFYIYISSYSTIIDKYSIMIYVCVLYCIMVRNMVHWLSNKKACDSLYDPSQPITAHPANWSCILQIIFLSQSLLGLLPPWIVVVVIVLWSTGV